MENKNEIWALHLDGKLISSNIWKEYSTRYGGNSLYGWRKPKRLYMKIGHAKSAIHHLPKEVQDKVEIVKYIPAKE